MTTMTQLNFNMGPYVKNVLKSSPLKPVSQFKANKAWMVLKWSIFHLGWRSGSQHIILKVDHLRTIHAMFSLNWLTGFRGEDF
jgi:hypothetical protein